MGNKALHDSNGNLSSKRIAGTSAMFSGIALLLTIGIFSLFKEVADPSTAVSSGQALAGIGAGLLAAGVIEKFGKKEDPPLIQDDEEKEDEDK